jgi:hypothetical protein
MAKGGKVKRLRFDTGGAVPGTPTTVANTTASGIQGIAQPTGGYNPLGAAYGALGTPIQNGISGAGGLMQGISSAFTTQNQFQAGTAPTDYSNYGNTIGQAGQQALQGYGNFQSNNAQQQALANQLQQGALGQGPNPALAQLQQTTGQNVAQQGALMASQRGASSNPALLARQAAQQGASTQQQAVGQAATQQAQQQIAYQQALGQQQANMQSANAAEQGVNANVFGGAAGAQNTQNANTISNWNNAQTINAGTAQNNANAVNKTTSGLLGGASSLLSMLADGGEVEAPEATPVATMPSATAAEQQQQAPQQNPSGPQSSAGAYLASDGRNVVNDPGQGAFTGMLGGGKSDGSGGGAGIGALAALMSKGGKVPALVSPGERYLPPKEVKEVAAGRKAPMKAGEEIKGKPKVGGAKDSYANDTVEKNLDEGGVVLPRSVTQSKDADSKSRKFVGAVLAKKNMRRS